MKPTPDTVAVPSTPAQPIGVVMRPRESRTASQRGDHDAERLADHEADDDARP